MTAYLKGFHQAFLWLLNRFCEHRQRNEYQETLNSLTTSETITDMSDVIVKVANIESHELINYMFFYKYNAYKHI